MDLIKYLTVLVLFLIEDGDTGGHGEKHHDHVKLHMPEFIHHDHHTKVITIHHHHHKPKKEHHHHHHHHHHPKPHIPHGHHYHKHHTKLHTTTKTVSKGKHHKHHGNHGHHGHHGHSGHHGHHGNHGYNHGHHHGHHGHHDTPLTHGHHDYGTPSYNYEPPATTFEEDFASFSPAVSAYGGHITPAYGGGIPQTPRVQGVSHTVKKVNIYDSLPGAIPSLPAKSGQGYEVTEADEDDDDSFTSVNSLQQSYPSTYGFVRGVAPATHDPFGEIPQGGGLQANELFAVVPQPTSAVEGVESFTGGIHPQPFSSLAPAQGSLASIQPSPEFPVTFQGDSGGFGSTANTFVSADDGGFQSTANTFGGTPDFGSTANTFAGTTGGTAFASDDNQIHDETPVSYSREAGIQQTVKTGGSETVVY